MSARASRATREGRGLGRDAGGLEDGPVGHMEVLGKQRRRPHEQMVGLTDSLTLAYMPKTEQLLT